jgi:ComF family protein
MPGDPVGSDLSEARLSTGLRVSLHHIWQTCFDLVFPPRCAGCGCADVAWCMRCMAATVAVPLRLTTRSLPAITCAATGTHQGQLQLAVQALKYDQVTMMARPLAKRLHQALDKLGWQPDLILPVPMHQTRQTERGYNQAYLLAAQLAQARGIPCLPQAARRERYTRSQVGLNHDERLLNVMNAFTADPALVSDKIVLMIDDVLTTGATLNACGTAVSLAGAKSVYGLTVTEARG